MSGAANSPRGVNPYKCHRPNCGDVLGDHNSQPEHVLEKHGGSSVPKGNWIPTASDEMGHEGKPANDTKPKLANNLDVPESMR